MRPRQNSRFAKNKVVANLFTVITVLKLAQGLFWKSPISEGGNNKGFPHPVFRTFPLMFCSYSGNTRMGLMLRGCLTTITFLLLLSKYITFLSPGIELQKMQMGTEDLSCLPSLKVDDLSRKFQEEDVEITQAGESLGLYYSLYGVM